MEIPSFEVIIIGGGPAGLSAALVLGRCCRQVLLCDEGVRRSWAAKSLHGFLTRDGIAQEEFRAKARADLEPYKNVILRDDRVIGVEKQKGGFVVTLESNKKSSGRKLLLATGVMDELPPVAGIMEFYGTSVFHCPYCDGWEFRDKPIAVYGQGARGISEARALWAWSRDVVLCTDGSELSGKDKEPLIKNGIQIIEAKILGLRGEKGMLSEIVFASGMQLERKALFFNMPSHHQSDLAQALGCRFTEEGGVACEKYQVTDVPGLYVAGNILREVQLAIVAAGEGATAAYGIHKELLAEDF